MNSTALGSLPFQSTNQKQEFRTGRQLVGKVEASIYAKAGEVPKGSFRLETSFAGAAVTLKDIALPPDVDPDAKVAARNLLVSQLEEVFNDCMGTNNGANFPAVRDWVHVYQQEIQEMLWTLNMDTATLDLFAGPVL